MMNTKQINDLMNIAFSKLEVITGIDYEKINRNNKTRGDARVKINLRNSYVEFEVEGKSEVRELGSIWVKLLMKYHNEDNLRDALILSRYFSPNVKQELKDKGISYLEASGNCCIQKESVFVFIEGQKSGGTRIKKVNKSFNNPGLKLILSLLLEDDLVNASYRNMAEVPNIALGSVGWILRDLKQQGYISESGKIKSMTNKLELFNRWVELYPHTLKKKLVIGRYRCIDESLKFKNNDYWLMSGLDIGEKPKNAITYSFYTNVKNTEFKKKFGFVKDDKGEVEVITPFWNIESEAFGNDHVMNPLLNYADRVNHPTKSKLNSDDINNFKNTLKKELNEKS